MCDMTHSHVQHNFYRSRANGIVLKIFKIPGMHGYMDKFIRIHPSV